MENIIEKLSPEELAAILSLDEPEQEVDETLFAAKVQWHPVDLMDMYPERFESIEEAHEWLLDNESYIQEAMTSAARDALDAII